MPRHFLSIFDLDRSEIESLIENSIKFKDPSVKSKYQNTLEGKVVGMLFEKLSTRTRVSFEAGIKQLGGDAIFMNTRDMQIGRGEALSDTARVLSSYLDGVIMRTFEQSRLLEFSKNSSVPVINALTDSEHPCQIISDLFTIKEKGLKLREIKIAYVGDGNNIANTLIGAAGILGFRIEIATPVGYEPDIKFIRDARKLNNGEINITNDPKKASKDADVLYTDVWVSMGQENETSKRLEVFKPYQINKELLAIASPKVLVMHCLPAHRGKEISEDVIDGPNSVIFEQAKNRLITGKAILEKFICD